MTNKGIIIARFGANVLLYNKDGEILPAVARKKLTHIACGDHVEWLQNAHGDISIETILPRKNCLRRTDYFNKIKTLAANIDQVIIMIASKPEPDWALLDQLMLSAESLSANVIILIHKSDLGTNHLLKTEAEYFITLGYTVLQTSIHDESLDELTTHLAGKTNILVGQSGVGKSSLVSRLLAEQEHSFEIKINEISKMTGQGQHTTVVSRSYPLPGEGWLIDSPGIREFTPTELTQDQVKSGFIEISNAAKYCRFHNCCHDKEPGCAVKDAVGKTISNRRYQSYLRILHEKLS